MQQLLAQLLSGNPLDQSQTQRGFELIMTGQATASQIGAFLALIQAHGPIEDELVGAAMVMRAKVTPVQVPQGLTVLDTCGTGGDHAGSFNVSTAAALVTAGIALKTGASVAVAKHGNRSVTSQSGSSQVLEALGVKLKVTPATLTACLDQARICFCFAPAHHPAMRYAAPIRAELGFRTIFNILGPLTNPAGARRQVIGVFDPKLQSILARVLARLGSEQVMVVHGLIQNQPGMGLDEISLSGPTQVSHLKQGKITEYELNPTRWGLKLVEPESLKVDTPDHSAAIIRQVLDGKPGPARDIVVLNAAAAALVAGMASDWPHGLQLAQEALDSHQASEALARLIRLTQADPTPVG